MNSFIRTMVSFILCAALLLTCGACAKQAAAPAPTRAPIDPAEMARKAIENHRGNGDAYAPEHAEVLADSPLAGMNVCFLGSSVTYGEGAKGCSFVEILAKRHGLTFVKEAVSGTTLTDKGEDSYVQRMKRLDPSARFDLFICQLSTNDATEGLPLGAVSEGTEPEGFDTSTIAGSMEYIIYYARKTWGCPVMFYTGTRYTSPNYEQMVTLLQELQAKWGIGVIDLWNDEALNSISEEDRALYMLDGVHPTMAGYLLWWTPFMEDSICSYLAEIR